MREKNSLCLCLMVVPFLGMSACAGDGGPVGQFPTVQLESAKRQTGFLRVENPVEDRYIVVLKEGGARAAFSASRMASTLASEFPVAIHRTYEHAIKGFVGEMSEDDAIALSVDPRVAWVEQDGVKRVIATQTNATWGLDRSDQNDLPLDREYNYTKDGTGVTAYVVDTGIRKTHSDFGGRASYGFSSIDDGNGANDCHGHGTHVSGTVGGSTWGIAKNVNLVGVRVLSCSGEGTDSEVLAGIDWIVQNATLPAVANMSLGGEASTTLDDGIQNAIAAGITFVVAAGNENQDACNVSPARVPDAITVGATTSRDARASYSNWGSCLDIFAPGSSITSASASSDTSRATKSGTSMASPHVAGAAALYLQENPSATPAEVVEALTSNASANKVSGVKGSANKLLYTVPGGDTPPPPPPPAPVTELVNGEAVAGLSAAKDAWVHFRISVPEEAVNLEMKITVSSGDPDLHTKFGGQPTSSSYDCRPYKGSGQDELCTVSNPSEGDYYLSILGYSSFSGVTIVAAYQTGGGGGGEPCSDCTQYTGSLSGAGEKDMHPDDTYYYAGSSGRHEGWLEGPASADFDLQLYKWNGSGWAKVDESAGASSSEAISYSGTSGYYYWSVYSSSGSGDYDFWLRTP